MRKKLLLLLGLLGCVNLSFAQVTVPAGAVGITVDFTKNAITPAFPYNQPFQLSGTAPAGVVKMKIYIKQGYFDSTQPLDKVYDIGSTWTGAAAGTFTLMVDKLPTTQTYLLPDHHYSLEIISTDATGKTVLDFRVPINTMVSAGDFVKIDFGVLYAPRPRAFSGEVSAHIFLEPVNNDTDMSDIDGCAYNIFQRVNAFIGISILNFDNATKQPMKNYVGLGDIVYGVGIHSPFYGRHMFRNNQVARRILQPMYLNVGELLFKQADANPLIVKDRNKSALYVGISYDFNFSTLFGPLSKFFAP